jgi:hypothetical protein
MMYVVQIALFVAIMWAGYTYRWDAQGTVFLAVFLPFAVTGLYVGMRDAVNQLRAWPRTLFAWSFVMVSIWGLIGYRVITVAIDAQRAVLDPGLLVLVALLAIATALGTIFISWLTRRSIPMSLVPLQDETRDEIARLASPTLGIAAMRLSVGPDFGSVKIRR